MTHRPEQDLCTSVWLHAKIGITEDGIRDEGTIFGSLRWEHRGMKFLVAEFLRFSVTRTAPYGGPLTSTVNAIFFLSPRVAIKGLRSAPETNPIPFAPSRRPFPRDFPFSQSFLSRFSLNCARHPLSRCR